MALLHKMKSYLRSCISYWLRFSD